MPQWISLNNAAWKYGVTEEDVRFWAEQREIASVHTGAVYIVDDESIQEFLCQFRIPPTKEVLVTQKQIYENQEVICELYAEIIEQKEREVASLKEKITRMQEVQLLMKAQSENIQKRMADYRKNQQYEAGQWIAKLWKNLIKKRST